MLTFIGKLTGSEAPAYIGHSVVILFEQRISLRGENGGGQNVGASNPSTGNTSLWIASEASADVAPDGSFIVELAVESPDDIRGNLVVKALAPDGQVLAQREVAAANLGLPIDIVAPAKRYFAITPSADPFIGQNPKLRGYVLDAAGIQEVAGRQVVLWAKPGGDGAGPAGPIATARTDSHGYFSVPFPREIYAEAYAMVAAGGEQRVPILLERGRLPRRLVLVVDMSAVEDTAKGGCGCEVAVSRVPDSEDLTTSPSYSTDLGGRCVDFTVPNRSLEEFSFYTVVRTTEPAIKGLTLPAMAGKTVGGLIFSSDISSAFDPADVTFKPVSGRTRLSAKHPVDWDETPTFYQAATIAHGHILHFKQTWTADRYSLGDLLYSLPLAPCQKKQIAVVDWTRREVGARTERLEEEERLSALLSHDRDVSEVMNGTLRESMRGGSHAGTWGVAGGLGAAASGALGGLNLGAVFGVSGGGSGADSTAWQDASKTIGAQALQGLRDMTMQSASAVRGQRATVVQTVEQGEAVRVQTEVVTNHNHCHAITIQYFEVLRHLQVSQQIVDVQECLFVPLLMTEFDAKKALRWRTPLLGALLDQTLTNGFDAIDRVLQEWKDSDLPDGRFSEETIQTRSGEMRISFRLTRPADKKEAATDETKWGPDEERWKPYEPLLSPFGGLLGLSELYTTYFLGRLQAERNRIFHEQIAPRIAKEFLRKLRFRFLDKGGLADDALLDPTLVSKFEEETDLYVSLRPGGTPFSSPPREWIDSFEISSEVELPDYMQVIVHSASLRYSTAHLDHFLFRDSGIDNDLDKDDPIRIYTPCDGAERRNPKKEDHEVSRKLLAHLNDHLEYYHRLLWWTMDPERRYMLMDGFEAPNADGRSVASVVENNLIGIVGNCLVMPVARGVKLDPTYSQDLKNPVNLLHLYAPSTPIPPMRISLPTRGVFAESVMGSCNSCEEKDETRFWRFEESPCGDEPTPIQSPGAESRRADAADLTAKGFPTPVINIQNAPAAPDPTGLAAALKVLAAPSAFANVTGLDQTQRNALAALQTAMQGAEFFGGTAADLAKSAGRGTSDGKGSTAPPPNAGTIDKTMQTIDKAQASGHLSNEQAGTLKTAAIERMIGSDTPNAADLERVQKAADQGLISSDDARDITASILRKQAGVDDTQRLTDDPDVSRLLQAAADEGRGVTLSRLGEAVEVGSLAPTGSGTNVGGGSASGSPFRKTPYDPEFYSDLADPKYAAFAARVEKLKADPRFSDLSVALVDLTRSGIGGHRPAYAGWNDTQQRRIGSTSKIGVMYAAFELRKAARDAAKSLTAKDQPDLFRQLTALWSGAIATGLDPLPRGWTVPPNLAKIFLGTPNASGQWTVDFTTFNISSQGPGKPPLTLDQLHSSFKDSDDKVKKLSRELGFRERMYMMIHHSDNSAADTCVDDLWFRYIGGALKAAGFLDAENGGVWVGGHYHENVGVFNIPKNRKFAGPGIFGGTARTIAALVTELALDELVDAASSKEMRDDFLRSASGWFGASLASVGKPVTNIYNKDGANDDDISECAFIERNGRRYVAVILSTQKNSGPVATPMLIDPLDQVIVDCNP